MVIMGSQKYTLFKIPTDRYLEEFDLRSGKLKEQRLQFLGK
jgi:hypothetical protein